MRNAPTSGVKVVIVRIGMLPTSIAIAASLPGRQDEERAGHDDQADGDPQGVVLHAPGLDAPEVLAGVDGRRRDVVDGVVDDPAVEPPGERRDAATDDDEDQVVEI